MWAVGVVLYILLCGFPPFYAENTAELFEQIMNADFSFPSPYWDKISDSAKDLIHHLLVVDPASRWTADQAMRHPWVTGASCGDTSLMDAMSTMKNFNARRKFKMGIVATIAGIRMRKAMTPA